MLKIRADQQSEVAESLFVERLRVHWNESFPQRFTGLPKEEIDGLAGEAVREAQAKGIENEDQIVIHADLCLAAGTGFAAQMTPQERKPNA